MREIIIKPFMNKICRQMIFLLFCSLSLSGNTYSRNSWDRTFTNLDCDTIKNAIIINFEFFDYFFGPFAENGYLKWCDFSYSTDGIFFTRLFRAETNDQGLANWTWLKMRHKRAGAEIQLLTCYKPQSGTMWPDNDDDVAVEVKTLIDKAPCENCGYGSRAYMTVKWFLNTPNTDYRDVKSIRIDGYWKVNGIYTGDDINIVYDIPVVPFNPIYLDPAALKSGVNSNQSVHVSAEGDAVVVKGAMPGEKAKVYNTSGAEVQSILINNDVVRIKLPKNQIYFVNIGQAHYKVSL